MARRPNKAGEPDLNGSRSEGYLLTLQKDLQDIREMERVQNLKMTFPDPSDITHFIIDIGITSGIYKGGHFKFDFKIPPGFRAEKPIVRILTKVWHPNIMEPKDGGEICLSVLRKEYRPANPLRIIVDGLIFLFLQPNPKDPLNIPAAQQMLTNLPGFKAKVEEYMQEAELEDEN